MEKKMFVNGEINEFVQWYDDEGNIIPREKWFADSMSLSKVCLTSAVLPGYGQMYNKQYWKLPILYSTVGASLGMGGKRLPHGAEKELRRRLRNLKELRFLDYFLYLF